MKEVVWVRTVPMKMVAGNNQRNACYYIIFGLWMCFDLHKVFVCGFRVLNLIFNWKPEKGSLYRWKTANFAMKCTLHVCTHLYATLLVMLFVVSSSNSKILSTLPSHQLPFSFIFPMLVFVLLLSLSFMAIHTHTLTNFAWWSKSCATVQPFLVNVL